METLTLTQNEALAAGGVIGAGLATYSIFAIAWCVLLIIAMWKIFTKAGEAGWKSIIPIYNLYVFCRIIKINFWIYMLVLPFVCGILSAVLPTVGEIATLAYAIFIDIFVALKLGDAFGKSTGFKVGLIFLPNIFQLILGFGDSKYHGATKKAA